MKVRIRFCTEGDELDAEIARKQYGFWATHCEAVMPYGSAIRYDDIIDAYRVTLEPDNWKQQLVVDLPATKKQHRKFYRFLGKQIGKRYDMRQLAGVRCHFENHKHDRWSCAFLVYAALVEAGILRKPPPFLGGVSVRDLMIAIASTVELPAIEYRHVEQRPARAGTNRQRVGSAALPRTRRHSDRHRPA